MFLARDISCFHHQLFSEHFHWSWTIFHWSWTSWTGIFVALTLVASTRGQTVPDGSRREGTKGPDIVQAVLDQVLRLNIITAEDELFLCQIAYVESQFGMMATTYGPGNNGGIWQVRVSVRRYPVMLPENRTKSGSPNKVLGNINNSQSGIQLEQ